MPHAESSTDLHSEVAALRGELAELRADVSAIRGGPGAPAPAKATEFWAVERLEDTVPEEHNGAVIFAGTMTPPGSERPVAWQWARTGEDLTDRDWSPAAHRLSALAHPVRLALLQEIFRGRRTVAKLAEGDDFGTTGQIYHHIGQLSAAGWLTTGKRGQYLVPPERVIPLLTLISAAS